MGLAEQPVLVRVPATSANLGPGFDTLGLALALHDDVEARVTSSGLDIEVTGWGGGGGAGGGGGDLAGAGEKHLIVRAMRVAFDELGVPQPDGLALRCVNRIPHGRGLGSSAAAIVAGLLAARALAGAPCGPDDVLPLASMLEGHPDNVAPCLFGGLTIAWLAVDDTGLPRARAIRLEPRPDVHPVVFIAPEPVSTSVARGLLPPTVPHADAARNAGRAALLIAALTARPEALLDGTEDKLHQDYRAPAMPHSHDLVTRLRAARVPAVVSGAGPSVLAFLSAAGSLAPPFPLAATAATDGLPVTGNPGDNELSRLDSIARETGIDWHITPLAVERQGASVAPSVSGAR